MPGRDKVNLGDLTRQELEKIIPELGGKATAAASVFSSFYKKSPVDLPGLTEKLWREITEKYPPPEEPETEKRVSAKDGTVKLLLAFEDGAYAECVILGGKDGRKTACVSSMSGCPCGCRFCATGAMGLKRLLSPSEIIMQFKACEKESGDGLASIVFMGMGEPFLNWTNVKKAIEILSDPKAFSFPQSKITVSTVGIIPVIRELAGSSMKIKLALSVVTSDLSERAALVPMEKEYPLKEALAEAKRYCEAGKDRQILAEYILFRGKNDTERHAGLLAGLLAGIPCRVNLIPYNDPEKPADGDCEAGFKHFQKKLIDSGLRTYFRLEKGSDIQAACGQLAADASRRRS